MTGKSRNIKIAVAVILIVGIVAAGFFFKDSLMPMIGMAPAGTEEAATEPAADNPAQMNTPTTQEGEAAMPSYDLTTDSEGLSKAVATMTLENGGVIKWRFFSNDAPNTVKRISQLISEGFYNGIVFHRVVDNFVVQAGDPTGTGTSGSGVKLKAEFNQHKHVKGIVSMARTQDPDSADSQFFIMIGDAPSLDGKYTVIGKVVEGYENVEGIRQGDKIKTFTIQ